jgi:hypothetical protein
MKTMLRTEVYAGKHWDRFGLGVFLDTCEGLGISVDFLFWYFGFTTWREG